MCVSSSYIICDFLSHSGDFHSFDTITNEGLRILTYARHSWPLSSEASSACHTYYDTGHPFVMVIFVDPWHSHLLPSVWSGAVTTCFNNLVVVVVVVVVHVVAAAVYVVVVVAHIWLNDLELFDWNSKN